MEGTFACYITRPWFVMPQQLSNSGNRLNLPVLRRWKSSAAWGRMECSCLNSEQMKRNESNMNVLWWLDLDREALPDVLRTVIEGKRMLALQLDQVGRWIDHRIPVQQTVQCDASTTVFHPLIWLDLSNCTVSVAGLKSSSKRTGA